MKRRLVKKWSKACKERPQSVKPAQMRYLFKGWVKSFKQLSVTQQYAVASTMKMAFGVIDFTLRLRAIMKAQQIVPTYPPGGWVEEMYLREPIGEKERQALLKGEWVKPGEEFTVRGEKHVLE